MSREDEWKNDPTLKAMPRVSPCPICGKDFKRYPADKSVLPELKDPYCQACMKRIFDAGEKAVKAGGKS